MKTGGPKIWIDKDNAAGEQKGEATVTYNDSAVAQSAISFFDGKDFNGSCIKVQMAMIKAGSDGGRGRGGDRGGRRGRGNLNRGGHRGEGGQSNFNSRSGDWTCSNPSCGNKNFSSGTFCSNCNTERMEGAGDAGGFGGDRGDGGDRGYSGYHHGGGNQGFGDYHPGE